MARLPAKEVVIKWSNEQLLDWLQNEELHDCLQAFKSRAVTGAKLLDLSDDLVITFCELKIVRRRYDYQCFQSLNNTIPIRINEFTKCEPTFDMSRKTIVRQKWSTRATTGRPKKVPIIALFIKEIELCFNTMNIWKLTIPMLTHYGKHHCNANHFFLATDLRGEGEAQHLNSETYKQVIPFICFPLQCNFLFNFYYFTKNQMVVLCVCQCCCTLVSDSSSLQFSRLNSFTKFQRLGTNSKKAVVSPKMRYYFLKHSFSHQIFYLIHCYAMNAIKLFLQMYVL
ncbi:unnamed protein product [Oppiella nova]|uniref:SAM domain-containing protein n=1 Tax=Oppiella nova TaxID=334625 RepID=A0A7R9LWH5_9ACAR|nr:unnamed protein product [Oppiella nova]CAG2166946.1 unnamed protein product [Oppiella nova]